MHWTYHQGEPDAHLCQGDILFPTPALTEVFGSVHQHFADPKYLGFMVTTQSCDLVRRRPGAPPKAAYISVATVRSLVSVWPKLLRSVARPLGGSFFSRKDEDKARDLFKRIVDQNEQALGVFYLHRDVDVGLADPAVAFLRVTVSLRAEHYDALLNARRGSLDPEFRAKFGWLVGNLYARAATTDWEDADGGKETIAQLTDEITAGASDVQWVDKDLAKAARKAKLDFNGDPDEVRTSLEGLVPRTLADDVVDLVVGRVKGRLKPSDEDLEGLKRSLLNDRELRAKLTGV